jgi:hypothetical protein
MPHRWGFESRHATSGVLVSLQAQKGTEAQINFVLYVPFCD